MAAMLEYLFFICAVLGGTVFVIQFVLALVGFGADGLHLGGDVPSDLPHDVLPSDLPHDVLPGDVPHDVMPGHLPHDASHVHGGAIDHGSTWLFSVISFRTVVAALAFFGIAGLTAQSAGQPGYVQVLVALVFGAGAMYGVHYLMRLLYRLGQDTTVRIERSVGKRGTVYVPIPANQSGAGKVQLSLPGGVMEYQAMTSEPEILATGAEVQVVRVISPTTLEVELVRDTRSPAGD
jgi:membrane protein implicated in regulation of membrane protease activity